MFGLDHGHADHDCADEHHGNCCCANEGNGARLDGLALRERHGHRVSLIGEEHKCEVPYAAPTSRGNVHYVIEGQ